MSQFVGKQDPGVRKATAIVNGEVITGSDVDHRLALIARLDQRRSSRPRRSQRLRAQVLRNLIDETLQIQAAAAAGDHGRGRARSTNIIARFAQKFRQTPDGVQRLSAHDRLVGRAR